MLDESAYMTQSARELDLVSTDSVTEHQRALSNSKFRFCFRKIEITEICELEVLRVDLLFGFGL